MLNRLVRSKLTTLRKHYPSSQAWQMPRAERRVPWLLLHPDRAAFTMSTGATTDLFLGMHVTGSAGQKTSIPHLQDGLRFLLRQSSPQRCPEHPSAKQILERSTFPEADSSDTTITCPSSSSGPGSFLPSPGWDSSAGFTLALVFLILLKSCRVYSEGEC